MNQKKQIRKARKWMRLHVILTAIVFGVYFLAAFFYSPHFFLSDIQAKIHALADTVTVTAKVLGTLAKPDVSVTASCERGDVFVDMDWGDDENTYIYDIARDGETLATGLTRTSYRDDAVAEGKKYRYVVTARGPMGSGVATSSDTFAVVSTTCPLKPPVPNIRITAIGDPSKTVWQSGMFMMEDSTPRISGTTSMPFAGIDITVYGDVITVAHTTANGNGYWQVDVSDPLTVESHAIRVVATDSADSHRSSEEVAVFRVVRPGELDAHAHDSDVSIGAPPQEPSFIDFELRMNSSDRGVFQGGTVDATASITRLDEAHVGTVGMIRYVIIDANGTIVTSLTREVNRLENGQSMHESIAIDPGTVSGRYTLQAIVSVDGLSSIREVRFNVAELPLFNLGAGTLITYPQLVRNIGWVAFISLFSMSSWSLLWIREYWLYVHAKRHIAERSLAGKGLIKKRKGVSL